MVIETETHTWTVKHYLRWQRMSFGIKCTGSFPTSWTHEWFVDEWGNGEAEVKMTKAHLRNLVNHLRWHMAG